MIALSAKAAEGRLLVVDGFRAGEGEGDAHKTKGALRNIADLIGEPEEANPSCLFVYGSGGGAAGGLDLEADDAASGEEGGAEGEGPDDDDVESVESLKRSTSNLRSVDTIDQIGLNVYSILRRRHLVVSRAALSDLTARLSVPLKPRERYVMAVRSRLLERAAAGA